MRSSYYVRVRAIASVAAAAAVIGGMTFIRLGAFGVDTLVSVGSPATPFSQNKQNEPALAIDAAHPNVVVAGSNDNIDLEACNAGDPTTCPFTAGVGGGWVYFSFGSGMTVDPPVFTSLPPRGRPGPAPRFPPPRPLRTEARHLQARLLSHREPAAAV